MMSLRRGPVVFAVEDTSAQLCWRRLPKGSVRITCGPNDTTFESDGGPGAAGLDHLSPGTRHVVRMQTTAGTRSIPFRTLTPPPGAELYRFATMSDLHLGRTKFGIRNTMAEPTEVVPHPVRCSDSALADLVAWGAQRLVIKGDLVDHNREAAWALAEDLIARVPVPWSVIPGNHELAHGDRGAFASAASHGIDLVAEVDAIDVPGLRIVLMNSAIEDVDVGRWGHLQDGAVAAVTTAPGPALLVVHHHPQPAPIPTHYPPGVSSVSARRFLQAVTAANAQVMGTSGHTHRHRYRTLAGVPWSEVGSTKDFPGTWAGYVVHEGGIRQVVRRVTDPGCLVWLDRTRHVGFGLWGAWTPGRLTDRCFTHTWPTVT